MNINLIVNSNQEISPPKNYENVLISDVDKIPPSICENLTINNTLNHLSANQFTLLLTKIRHGGRINK